MAIQLVTYRDEFFPGSLDTAMWRQVTKGFGLSSIQFLDNNEIDLGETVFVFDENGELPLSELDHPESATYIFGCTGMRDIHKQFPNAKSVRIEVPNTVENQGLFAHQAAAIVFYDRERKLWQ